MSSLIPAASTVASNSVLSVPPILLTTVKSAATVDFVLSRVIVTTPPPVSAQSTDADAVGSKAPSIGEPPHASSLSIPPAGVKASLSPLTSTSTAHSFSHSIGMANFFVAPAPIETSTGERSLPTTTCLPSTLTVTLKVAFELPSLVISNGNVEPVAVGLSSTQSGGHTTIDPRTGGSANGHPPPSVLDVFFVSPRVPKVNEPSASPSESSQVNWVRNAFLLLEKNTTVGSSLSTPPGLKLNAAP